MTAQDALTRSEAGVIRAVCRDGMVAVTRAAGGFQVSFIPKMHGEWNLAGTISLDIFPTLERAERGAFGTYDVKADGWEPGAENIVGIEPAMSSVPMVEGHHVRQHGRMQHPGEHQSTLVEHRLQRQLILFTGGLLPFAFAMDVMHHATGEQSYADAAYLSMWSGIAGALLAATASAVDYAGIAWEHKPGRASAGLHTGLNFGMLAVYGLNLLLRIDNGGRPGRLGTVLSGIATAGLIASAWYGGDTTIERPATPQD